MGRFSPLPDYGEPRVHGPVQTSDPADLASPAKRLWTRWPTLDTQACAA